MCGVSLGKLKCREWYGLFCLGSRSASLERPPYRCSEGCVLLEQCECLFRFNREHLLRTMLLGLTSVSGPLFLSVCSQYYQPPQEDWYHFWALHRPTTQGVELPEAISRSFTGKVAVSIFLFPQTQRQEPRFIFPALWLVLLFLHGAQRNQTRGCCPGSAAEPVLRRHTSLICFPHHHL